jgi:hypothetical protein
MHEFERAREPTITKKEENKSKTISFGYLS